MRGGGGPCLFRPFVTGIRVEYAIVRVKAYEKKERRERRERRNRSIFQSLRSIRRARRSSCGEGETGTATFAGGRRGTVAESR